MYGELSFVISLGLILILILTHFNYKSKLFNFENKLKTSKKTFEDKIGKMRSKVEINYRKFVGPIDCNGEWKCNDKCIKTFIVDTYPKYGGIDCPTETDSPPLTGPGSKKCVPGIHCPENLDCIWEWSACGSNCERELNIITPSSGDGITCPLNKYEAEKQLPILPCLDNNGRGIDNCVPSNCEGYWGSCTSNCEQSWIKTKDAVPLSKSCDNLGKKQDCTGDSCANKNCEWHWSPCIGTRRQSIRDSSGKYRKIVITGLPTGNGSACPTIESETDPKQLPIMPQC